MKRCKTIGFDADDTLWVNEPFFREAEKKFASILTNYLPEQEVFNKLFEIEMNNLHLYGYGVKGFILSLIETALKVSENNIPTNKINEVIAIGKELLEKPIELLDGVKEVLEELSGSHRLIVATKGDLLDQERKLKKSGLAHYFHHIEIMSDKQEENYKKLLHNIEIRPEKFLMVGNSMKSDILPVLNIGGCAIHIPFHSTWIHEDVNPGIIDNNNFKEVQNISDILQIIK